MLQSQLFGRALDMCKGISEELLMSPKGTDEVVNTIFRRDPLAVVKEVYQDSIDLLPTKRGAKTDVC